mgnify:FL=1|tara:strand:- start:241 stop:570 length:330 start_codon:yes stop_codon:yes gene_type:complete
MSKFKVGQVVSFITKEGVVGYKARIGGIITKVEQMYELKKENKRYYPSGECKGDFTTIKELSNGENRGYAYIVKSLQPEGYSSESVTVEEFKLKLSTKKRIMSYYLNIA